MSDFWGIAAIGFPQARFGTQTVLELGLFLL